MLLTKSSTIRQALRDSLLHELGIDLLFKDEDPVRAVYGTDSFRQWYEGDLCYLEGNDSSELDPVEEVDDFLRDFVLGRGAGKITRLQPTKDGVWEARLPQLRLFGWWADPGHLILHVGVDVNVVKGPTGYQVYIDEVLSEIQKAGVGLALGDILDVGFCR